MGWIAIKQQKVKRGDGYVTVLPGEPIPEAEKWPNRDAWVNQKSIKWVDGPPGGTDAPAATQAAPVRSARSPAGVADSKPPAGAEPLTEESLDGLDKKEIVTLAAERFGLELSARSRKGKLIAAVLEAQQEA